MSSSIELEYNLQECFNTLTDRLDHNNPEGDRYSFDMSKPLPLQGPPEVTYNTSITKIKPALYKIEGVEDMVTMLESYQTVFKEGDFVDLHMNDIEDMLLLAVQHKLFHLTNNYIVDFIVALRMFTRSLVIKKRVKDLQLGVEKTSDAADELYKFSDGTLKKVRDKLLHRVLNFDLGYNKEMERRKWTATDKKRSALMVELIDKQMRERRIIRNKPNKILVMKSR
ncbi:hypothetical protein Tco_0454479 [Tanacetum coccineum]